MVYIFFLLSVLTLALVFQTIRKAKIVKHYEMVFLNHISLQNRKLDTQYAELKDGLKSL